MQQKIKKRFMVIKDKWEELEKEQKQKVIIATTLVIATLIIFIYMISKPSVVTLIDNQEFGTIIETKNSLDNVGIKYKLINGSKGITVKESDYMQAQLAIAQNVSIDSKDFTFEDALNLTGMGTTQSFRRQALIEAQESKLRKALLTIEGVENAIITLDIPNSNNYIFESDDKATASAVLTTSRELSTTQANAVARLIQRSVLGLEQENIEIIDQNGNFIYSGSFETTVSGKNLEHELMKRNQIINDINAHLKNLYDGVTVSTNLVFDWDEVERISSTVTAPMQGNASGLISSQKLESSEVENSGAGLEPGAKANNEVINYTMGGSGQSSGSTELSETEYKLNELETFEKVTPGLIDASKSSVTVFLTRNKILNQKYLEKNDLLNGMSWEEYKDTINPAETFEVDEATVLGIENAAGVENVRVVGYTVPLFQDNVKTPINIQEIIIFVVLAILILLLGLLFVRNTKMDIIEEVEPELSVEDLLISSQIEEDSKIGEIPLKEEDEIKAQVGKFVLEKPEMAAQLLRNWLNQEWE